MTERAWRPGEVRTGRLEAAAWAQLEPPRRGPRDGSGGNAGNGMRGLSRPKTATAERREASAPIARCAPRPNQRGTRTRNTRLSALRHPLAGVAARGRIPGAPQAPRERERAAVRKELRFERSERVVAGTSGTGLFDIVNRGSAALPETSVLGPTQPLRVSVPPVQRAPTLPLAGRVDRTKRGGVGVVVVARGVSNNNDPRPQPLPTRGRGADRVRGAFVRQTRS